MAIGYEHIGKSNKARYRIIHRDHVTHENITGYDHYPFGVHNDGRDFIITHIPTGTRISYAPQYRLAKAIMREIEGTYWMDVTFDNASQIIPDEVCRYLSYGLKCPLGGFQFRTLDDFKKEFLGVTV